jgi:hypothetical protein
VIEPDQCEYRIQIEDVNTIGEDGWMDEFGNSVNPDEYENAIPRGDSWAWAKRLESGDVIFQYGFVAGNGSTAYHSIVNGQGEVVKEPYRWGGNVVDDGGAAWNDFIGEKIDYSEIIPAAEGMDQCGCDAGPASAEPPEGTVSWKGYNLGGAKHQGSSELGGLVFQESAVANPIGGSTDTTPISGTADDPLWQTVYYGKGFVAFMSFEIPVENAGTYKVTFYAVNSTICPTPNQDIRLENLLKIDNWQPYVGGSPGDAPWQKEATVEVTDGVLNIAVTAGDYTSPDKQVVLSAIKVEELE